MLPHPARLRSRAEFTETVRSGVRAGARTVVVHLAQQPSSSPAPSVTGPRAGFVVSRAVGGAVVRNRVRRQLRHLVRDRLEALPDGVRLVVRANPAAATAGSPRLAADVDSALRAALATASRHTTAAGPVTR